MSEEIKSEVVKFTEEEMQQLVQLQSRYQESLLKLGQHKVRNLMFIEEYQKVEATLREEEDKLKEEYVKIQGDESDVLKSLTEKYGEGTLDAKTGTFTKKS